METNSKQNTEVIKMVESAMDVLDLLRTNREPIGVNEIAKSCSLNPSTTFRILKTLEKTGWIFQLYDRRYIGGRKISFMTEKNNLYLALREVSHFVMDEYTKKYNQAMNLTVREDVNAIILQQSRTQNFLDYVPPLYTRLPIYASAGGKVLLSELPIKLVDQVVGTIEMKPLTEHTITSKEQFWLALREASKQGYAIDDRESAKEGSCIAVPVRDHEGTIIASLSFSGFIGITDPQELLVYLPALTEASEMISKKLFDCWEW